MFSSEVPLQVKIWQHENIFFCSFLGNTEQKSHRFSSLQNHKFLKLFPQNIHKCFSLHILFLMFFNIIMCSLVLFTCFTALFLSKTYVWIYLTLCCVVQIKDLLENVHKLRYFFYSLSWAITISWNWMKTDIEDVTMLSRRACVCRW